MSNVYLVTVPDDIVIEPWQRRELKEALGRAACDLLDDDALVSIDHLGTPVTDLSQTD